MILSCKKGRALFSLRQSVRRHPRLAFLVLALLTALAILLALRLAPKPALRDGIPYSLALQARNGELLRLTLAQDEQYRLWTPLAKMSPKLLAAVELYEDRWFRWHFGVNPLALLRGAWSTASGNRRLIRSTRSGLAMNGRPKAIRSASFCRSISSAVAGIKPPASISQLLNS